MFIPWYSPSVRLTGRWCTLYKPAKDAHRYIQPPETYTAATAPGSSFELGFRGSMCILKFDLGFLGQPYPHMWLSVDDGSAFEVPVDRYLRVLAQGNGDHILKCMYKGGMEMLPRWYEPLMGVISFVGAQAEGEAPLPPDERPLIEFVGDSITEGVLIDADFDTVMPSPIDQFNRPYQDDAAAAYGCLTARRLNMRYMAQAYGATGMTRTGCGSVPRCGLTYEYVFDGVPYTGEKPDVIVINHGANDRGASCDEYLMRYEEFLRLVRKVNPSARVFALSAFCGAFDMELGAFIPRYNEKYGDNVFFVSSKGWLPEEPLHPLREGHRIIADRLYPILRDALK